MITTPGRRRTWVALLMLCAPGWAWAEFPKPIESHSYRPYPPIELTSLVFEVPRPLRVWVAEVDLGSPSVEIVVTPRGQFSESLETACATTLDFAKSSRVQLAVNASPFAPFRTQAGQGMDIVGLGICDADVYSKPTERFGALAFDARGRARILASPIGSDQLEDVDDAVGGFRVLVSGGKSRASLVARGAPAKFAGPNPRTAVGLSTDGKTMWLVVIDGRQKGRSEGVTLEELADFSTSLGCTDLLNLDGGGSTTLVLQDPASKQWRVVNQPIHGGKPGRLRLVGNNLGIRVRQADAKP